MKAFVTGATGFIGSNLVDRLLHDDYDVKILVRKSSNSKFTNKNNLEIVIGDISDVGLLEKVIKEIDVVFNLAAVLPHHNLTEEKYMEVNAYGVRNIVNACVKYKSKKLVHVSTVGVFGKTSTDGIDEHASLYLSDFYTKSKAIGDKFVLDAIKKHKLEAVIIRPTIAYGPGDIRPGFSNLFSLIKKGLFVPIGNSENYFHTIYISNLIDGLILASTNKNAIGQDFIIGDQPCPKMKDIIQAVAAIEKVTIPPIRIPFFVALLLGKLGDLLDYLGLPFPLKTQRVKFITENRRYNLDKAKKLLGYKARVGLTEGVKETYLWYKNEGFIANR